jgi:hypothetical protein
MIPKQMVTNKLEQSFQAQTMVTPGFQRFYRLGLRNENVLESSGEISRADAPFKAKSTAAFR